MALALDGSSPAIATAINTSQTVVTASFTPPTGSVLLVAWSGNSGANNTPSAPSITDSLGAHLTYTLVDHVSRSDSPACDGQAATWWATVGTSAAMTVTVTNNAAAASQWAAALQVWVWTGADTAAPVGAHGKTAQTSGSAVSQNYTAQRAGGRGVLVINDWDATGAETAGSGCTFTGGGTGSIGPTNISYGFLLRTTADDVAGSTNTLALTLPGASTAQHWAYAEVLPVAAVADNFAIPTRRRVTWL